MADTGATKLPGIPTLRTDDRALAEWAKAVTEHLEVRNGGRGNPAEKTVVQRDLESIQTALAELMAVKAPTAAPGASTSASSTEATPASTSTLNADVARVERTLNAALESLRSRVASAEGQIASSGQGEPLFRGIFGDMTGPYEVNGSKRWSLHPDAGLSPFSALAGGGRSGAYTTTVGDVLASLSHVFYSTLNWGGSGSGPVLNPQMRIGSAGGSTLQNLLDRLVNGAVAANLNGDTAIGVAGMTLRSLHARVEQIGQDATFYLQDHERRIVALEARP